MIWKYI